MALEGKWVLTSNDDTLTAEGLALGYKQLTQVEQGWRILKSGLRMRPVYHWRPRLVTRPLGRDHTRIIGITEQ
jgi:hypothetical protein